MSSQKVAPSEQVTIPDESCLMIRSERDAREQPPQRSTKRSRSCPIAAARPFR